MKPNELQCSFCGKSQNAVEKLISAPQERPPAYICDECVRVCLKILDEEAKPPAAPDDQSPQTIPLWLVRMFGEHK